MVVGSLSLVVCEAWTAGMSWPFWWVMGGGGGVTVCGSWRWRVRSSHCHDFCRLLIKKIKEGSGDSGQTWRRCWSVLVRGMSTPACSSSAWPSRSNPKALWTPPALEPRSLEYTELWSELRFSSCGNWGGNFNEAFTGLPFGSESMQLLSNKVNLSPFANDFKKMNKLLQSIYVIKIDSMMCTQSVQSKRQSVIFCAIGEKQ